MHKPEEGDLPILKPLPANIQNIYMCYNVTSLSLREYTLNRYAQQRKK